MRIDDKWLVQCEQNIRVSLEKFFKKKNVSIDWYLEQRDSTTFDSMWVEAFEVVEERKKDLKKKEKKYIEDVSREIRERVFKLAISLSHDGDFSAAISDDAGLILESMMMEINNAWINGIIALYANSELPCGEIKLFDKNLFLS